MKYEVTEDIINSSIDQLDGGNEIKEMVDTFSSILNYDFSQLNITNAYEFNAILKSPENFIDDIDICKKLRDLVILMEMLGGSARV